MADVVLIGCLLMLVWLAGQPVQWLFMEVWKRGRKR
jgi:hypothetical protein